MNLPYLEEFSLHLRAKGRSRNTVEAYIRDLNQFGEFCENVLKRSPLELERGDMRRFPLYLREMGLSPSSIARKVSAVKNYYRFLLLRGYVKKDPSLALVPPKLPKRLPRPVGEDIMRRVLEEWKPQGEEDRLAQDLVLLLYGTGLRISELLSLGEEDVDFNEGVLRVRGKGGKVRVVPLHPKLYPVLERRMGGGGKLFDINRYKAYRLIKGFFEKAAGLLGVHPHVLRHTFATHMLNSGADLKTVQEILGHASLGTTQIYTRVSLKKMKEAYEKVWEE